MWADAGLDKDLYASAVGDVDPDSPGNEVVVGGQTGNVSVLSGSGSSWTAQKSFQDTWWITSLVIGDVDLNVEGNEIYAVGWSDFVTEIFKDKNGDWTTRTLWYAPDWLYGVAEGDFNKSHEGLELAVVGENRDLTILTPPAQPGGEWSVMGLWRASKYMDFVCAGDLDPSYPGEELVVAGGTGDVDMFWYNTTSSAWNRTTIGHIVNTAVIAGTIGEFSVRPGNELALVGTDGNVTVMSKHPEKGWTAETAFTDTDRLFDVEIGDVWPGHEGNELVAVGLSMRTTIVHEVSYDPVTGTSVWGTFTAFQHDYFLFTAAVGEFDPLHPGLEAAVGARDGSVSKVQFEPPGFVLTTSSDNEQVPIGGEVEIGVIAVAQGGFNGNVSLSLSGVPSGITATFSPSTIRAGGYSVLTIGATQAATTGKKALTIIGKSPDMTQEREISITVVPAGQPDFSLEVTPDRQSMTADFDAQFKVSLAARSGFKETVSLSIDGLPDGADARFSTGTVTPPGTADLSVSTIATTPQGEHHLTIKAASASRSHAAIVTISVGAPDETDFAMTFSPPSIDVVGGQHMSVDLVLSSLYGFSDEVQLKAVSVPDGVDVNITMSSVVPPASVVIDLETLASIPSGRYFLEIEGSGGGKTHRADLRMDVNLAGVPNYLLSFTIGDTMSVNAPGAADFGLSVTSSNGFSGVVTLSAQGLPSDVAWEFMPGDIVFDGREGQSNASVLSLDVGVETPGGNWSFIIEASGSGVTRTLTGWLNITAARAHVSIPDLRPSKKVAEPGSKITITAVVENDGTKDAEGVKVAFDIDGRPKGTVTVSVPAGGSVDAVLNLTTPSGEHTVNAKVVPGQGYEADEGTASTTIRGEYGMGLSLPWVAAIVVVTIIVILLLVAYVFGRTGGGKRLDVEMEDEGRKGLSSTLKKKKKKKGKRGRTGE